MVRDDPGGASIVHFILGINVALQNFVLKSISEAAGAPDGYGFRPQSGPRRQYSHQNVNCSEFNLEATFIK